MGTEIQLIQFRQYSLLMVFVLVYLMVFEQVPVVRQRKVTLAMYSGQMLVLIEGD